jgi:hypothetical protein
MLLLGLAVVDLGLAQSNDPQAAAPVVYSDAPTAPSDCAGANAAACDAQDPAAEDEIADSWNEDDVAYDAPVYDDYLDFYPGVSLLPVDYWAPGYAWGWGWPNYAPYGFGWSYYAGWDWGWPYLAFSWSWGWGGHHHHHGGWGGHLHHGAYAWQPYHGPYRYHGHGRYADGSHPPGMHGDRIAASTTSRAPFVGRANIPVSATHPARTAVAANRATLASASYYSLAQRNGMSPTRSVANMSRQPGTTPGSNNRSISHDSHWVTSMPSRNYAHAGSAPARTSFAPYPHTSPGYATRHDYAVHPYTGPTRSAPPQHSAPIRGYSASPALSHNGGGSHASMHAGGGSSSHSSGGSHANTGSARMH